MLVPRVKCWRTGLGSISTRADKVLTLAQPDRQGSLRGTTHQWACVTSLCMQIIADAYAGYITCRLAWARVT